VRAVLDANVIVSAAYTFQRPSSQLAHILRSGIRGRYVLVTSDAILDEVRSAMAKQFFTSRVTTTLMNQILDDLERKVEKVDITGRVQGVATHWQDDRVLETALEGQADYLVTGDRELLALKHPFGFQIIHPNAFLAILEGDEANG
jgi:putative PIN family toxin of toxin-antitoxin system